MRIALLCIFGAVPRLALAHLDLRAPASRYGASVLKEGPCGRSGGDRSANVSVFRPGETIEVRWNEYVDHPGHFRIAFDPDGDDDFVDPRCLSGCNTTSPSIELYSNAAVIMDDIPDTAGGTSGVSITLPDIECASCTLQVIQIMYDKPPYTSPGNDIYYQCADLMLVRGPEAADGGTAAMDASASDATFEGGTATLDAAAADAMVSGTDAAGGMDGEPPAISPPPQDLEGGCACSLGRRRGPTKAVNLSCASALVLLACARRRSRRARSRS